MVSGSSWLYGLNKRSYRLLLHFFRKLSLLSFLSLSRDTFTVKVSQPTRPGPGDPTRLFRPTQTTAPVGKSSSSRRKAPCVGEGRRLGRIGVDRVPTVRAATRIATRPVFSSPAAAARLKPVGIGSVGRPRSIPGGVEARFTAESGGGGSQSFRQVSGMFPAD